MTGIEEGFGHGQVINRCTAGVRNVLELAEEEARRFNPPLVEPYHILLGLVREPDGLAARILLDLGVNLGNIPEQTTTHDPKEVSQDTRPIAFSSKCRAAVETAAQEAAAREAASTNSCINTGDLLLGVLSVSGNNGNLQRILGGVHINLQQIRDEISKA